MNGPRKKDGASPLPSERPGSLKLEFTPHHIHTFTHRDRAFRPNISVCESSHVPAAVSSTVYEPARTLKTDGLPRRPNPQHRPCDRPNHATPDPSLAAQLSSAEE